jgi:membrane fusion protein (multidrug efflux system)
VRFSLAGADFNRIRRAAKDSRVSIESQDGAFSAKNGRLNFTGSTVDPKLGTVQLRAAFPNPALTWLPGQFVKVRIFAGEQDAFLVPQSAVIQTEQARMVWIAEPDGRAAMRPVQTANWIGADWIVTDGLKAGDAVIVDNLMKLRPGAPVQAQSAAAQPGAPATPPAAAQPERSAGSRDAAR